ncbi:MAG: D-alanine--D-alanine ligase A [Acidobacteria bacterium RIFCSPLOWO2_12_FULL_65_11]|nr:MAG: D-alanine--D-alanine ligase A [Acidobacteria bacterium RIFCSPLOWO2_02_FULL_64_15]OFW32171.1 MAG: D-alanine--D-alanine ligase A [Acidobacteria bacterium RIFCSPLOWO2_12_FULL_65_11]
MSKKLRVGIIYGGRSGEHDVSLASGAAVFKNLDPERYDAVPIRIERDGRWSLPDHPPTLVSAAAVIEAARPDRAEVAREAHLVAHPDGDALMTIDRRGPSASPTISAVGLDVIFPVLHGPYGEDGTVQGLLELAGVPYVGAGVLASAIGMDKAAMKLAFAARGLPICDYEVVLKRDWRRDERGVMSAVVNRLGLPVFIKPANLGSSVGISKVKHAVEFVAAMNLAAQFDRKIVIEAAVPHAREIECSVLGNDEPEASIPGEVVPSREFYDFEAKYIDEGSRLLIPAPLTDAQAAEVRTLALAAFKAIDGAGMARVDFLLAGDSGILYLNEVNTIPGFTTIGMYAKLWEASGLSFPALLDRLIALALERHAEKQQLRTSR